MVQKIHSQMLKLVLNELVQAQDARQRHYYGILACMCYP